MHESGRGAQGGLRGGPAGFRLVEVAGGYQIVTRSASARVGAPSVPRTQHDPETLGAGARNAGGDRLSSQPITSLEIGEIRGVSTSGVINTLLERSPDQDRGPQAGGRASLHVPPTKDFLIRFGLNDLTDLPKVEDMAEALGVESPLLVEQTPAEEQLPLSEPDEDVVAFDEEPSSGDGSGSGSIH